LISLIAIIVGIPAIAHLVSRQGRDRWTRSFLIAAALTTATGFMLPLAGLTPAVITGIVAALVLALVLLARYGFDRAGIWHAVDAIGLVISLYLLVFVLIAQAFGKIPSLNALAPTVSEPAFAVAQLLCLAVFVWIGFRAVRGNRPGLAA
jgi:hypothetical protein